MKYSIKVNEVRAKEGSNIKGFATVVFGDSFKITNIAILENKDKLDKQFILRSKKETYGYSCLTNQKQYYMENYPKIAIEKGTIDEVITMMIRGTEQ